MKNILITTVLLFCLSVLAGNIELRNERACKEHQVNTSTNVYSLDQLIKDIEACKNLDEVKSVLKRKFESDSKKEKELKAKISVSTNKISGSVR